MAEDLSLLLRIRGEASGSKAAIAETRAAIGGLRSEFSGLASQLPGLDGLFASTTLNLTQLAKNAEGVGAGIAGLAGPIGIAVIGLGALAGAAIEVAKQFVDLTVATAEWQGALIDLSRQTGISVETLSSLEVLAKITGSSEQLTASLGIFQKNLEQAQDPTTKQAELLKKLGVETTDTEQAFRDVIKALGAMPEGFQQTAAALELFGRGGKSVLAIIKETNGNLDEAIEKFREMGIVVGTQDAKAAEQFNVQLSLLHFQIRAITATLTKESIPQILSSLKELSKILQENQAALTTVGTALAVIVRDELRADLGALTLVVNGLAVAWRGVALAINAASFGFLSIPKLSISGTGADAGGTATVGEGIFRRTQGGSLTGGAGLFREATAGGRAAATEKLSAGQRLLNQLTDEYNRIIAKANNLDRVAVVTQELLKKEYDDINPALKLRILGEADLIKELEKSEVAKKRQLEIEKELAAAAERAIEAANRLNEERLALEDKIAEAVQNQREALSELEGFEKTHLQIVEEFIAQQVKQAEAVGGVTEKMKEYFALLIKIAAKEDEIEANRKKFEGVTGGASGASSRKTGSSIQSLFAGINENLIGNKQTGALAGLQALTDAFEGLGQAVGQVVASFVLYGTSGTSVRKMTAEILAGVAQQAAIKAVFELAEGFAALALAALGWVNQGVSATLHFQAAAMYGAIAGVAAIAGRGIAGNSFSRSGTSGGGGTGGGGTNASSSSAAPLPIVLGSQRQAAMHVTVDLVPNRMFDARVVSVVTTDARNGGMTRKMLTDEIRRQE